MSGHTPGPWTHYHARLRPQYPVIVNEIHGPAGQVIVQWGGFDAADGSKSVRKANARLIAAAPKALVLARYAVDNPDFDSAVFDRMAREFIAAATGEQP